MHTPPSPPPVALGTTEHPTAEPLPPGHGRLAAAVLVLLASVGLAWLGGLAGAAGALAAGLLLPWLGYGRPAAQLPANTAPRPGGGRLGAEVMVAQVLPVWSKQLDLIRDAANHGLSRLQRSFGTMAGALDTLDHSLANTSPPAHAAAAQAAHEPHTDRPADRPTDQTAHHTAHQTADQTAHPHAGALAALLLPSQRAFAQRDAAVQALIQCAEQLQALRQLGQHAREIGKHTRLVAFNASIEANRGNQGSAGSGGNSANARGRDSSASAMADETRTLAGRMAAVGEQIEKLVAKLDSTLSSQRLRSEIDDTTTDELRLELDLRAREALASLLSTLGAALHSAADIKLASQALRAQVQALVVQFQFGDRVKHMLDTVDTDMQGFVRWVASNPYASQTDAADWLAKLERSYTLEAQRARHHGTVHIERGNTLSIS